MESSIFDDEVAAGQAIGNKLLESYRFWNGRWRFIFNIIVGVTGIVAMFLFSGFLISLFDVAGIIAWGIVANILYSAGYMLESFIIVKSYGKRDLKSSRVFLFWAGTICYSIASFIFCQSYFIPFAN